MGVLAAVLDVLSSVSFFAGIVVGAVGYWTFCRAADYVHNRRTGDHRHTRIKSTWAAGGLLLIFMAYSMVSTAEADRSSRDALARAEIVAADAKAFAEETRRCQNELLGALNYNRTVTTDNDDLSLRRFVAVVNWFHDLAFPPPEIAALEQNDPRRVQWAVGRTQDADREVRGLIEEQRANSASRAPYPPPNCGR